MRSKAGLVILLTAVFSCCLLSSKAQTGLCPPNMDFEMGDFTNWDCRVGDLASDGTINWSPVGPPVPGRHTIMSTANAGTDIYGGFPQLNPNTGNFNVMLGNTNSPPGRQASEVSYTYTIPASATVFSVIFWYAIVLHDPGGQPHSSQQRPRFKARIFNVTDNQSLPCVDFDFISAAGLPGFRNSTINPNVIYKDWTPITLNLSTLAGKTIRLEFDALDCTLGGHFGYAYVDVSSFCNGVISGNYICPNTSSITMTAPFGFQGYTWYSDITFSTVIGIAQTLTLNPAPAVGSVIPVVVTPYPGFGCQDTLYAVIDVANPPNANAGPDITVCEGTRTQIGTPPVTGYNYAWTPAAFVSNPNIANPVAFPPTPAPTEFIVEVTEQLTGCVAYDTTYVSTAILDTALSFSGSKEICIGEPGPTLSVSATMNSVQWYESGTPIPGATGISFQPTVTGDYWAEISQGGCLDSTRTELFTVHPLPIASFTSSRDTGCVRTSSFDFTNTSTSPDNANMTYLWTFSDGVIQTSNNVTRGFNTVGNYNVQLEATTEFGCKGSTAATKTVYVLPSGKPNFTYDSVCVGKFLSFHNLSNENGSARSYYLWEFNNGDPKSSLKDPLPVVYNLPPGKVDVILKMTTLGCESDTQTMIKTIQVNKQAPGFRYHDITIPQASSKFVHVRDSVGNIYSWRPRVLLSSYDTRYTEVTAQDDITYFIDITDIHTCVTTDTLQVLVLKKPGFYLPSAFTPNNDGLNDIVRPYLVGMKGLASFSIYNRWGNLIYYTEKYGEGWNGKKDNVTQAAGVYIWILKFRDANDKMITEKGTITLVR